MKSSMFLLSVITLFLITSCEERIFPGEDGSPVQLVVEGSIEGGEIPAPAIVILTRSLNFSLDGSRLSVDDLFVHDALVEVSDGENTIQLTELCWDDLNEDQKKAVLENFNTSYDSVGVNICVYADQNLAMLGEIGKTYALHIEADGQVLNASTTIPPHVPIDSLFFRNRTGDSSPDFYELIASISDEGGQADFYRYFTSTNGSFFDAPLTSVGDDLLFDGQSFKFPLTEGETGKVPQPAPEDYGYFFRGDTIALKWTNLDEAHFNFWSTLEFNFFNQGPFGSYTRIDSNIEGGLGVWGGYSSSYYVEIVGE